MTTGKKSLREKYCDGKMKATVGGLAATSPSTLGAGC